MVTTPVVISGTKKSLDAANTWAHAVLVSILGPEEGERVYKTLPALPVLLAYRRLMDETGIQ